MAKFHCQYEENHSPHLSQFFKGLKMLENKGLVTLERTFSNSPHGVINVLINNEIKLVVDAIDEISHIEGSLNDKIKTFFGKRRGVDIIFKRGYVDEMKDYNDVKVYPLGLNYSVEYDGGAISVKEKVKNYIKNIEWIRKLLKADKYTYPFEMYEQMPILHREHKILFLTRLWNPVNAIYPSMKEEWEAINHNRVEAIRLCRKEFGKYFLGGLEDNEFTRKYASDVILGYQFTNKASYLELMKQHNICIATTGLHGSIGWKFAEYVAASRCIVSEPLEYKTTGDFAEGKNYMAYHNPIEMLEKINHLLENPSKMLDMMYANYLYYNSFMRPDNLVLNILMQVEKDFFTS